MNNSIAVVGAGIAGLAFTLGLARICPELMIHVIESQEMIHDEGGVVILAPNGLSALEQLDPNILSNLSEGDVVQLKNKSKLMSWYLLRKIFMDKCCELKNVEFHTNTNITNIHENDCVEVRFRESDLVLSCAGLVASDGVNSMVRRELCLPQAKALNMTIWRGICDSTEPVHQVLRPLFEHGTVPVFLRLNDSILKVYNIKGRLSWSILTKKTDAIRASLLDLFAKGAKASGGFGQEDFLDCMNDDCAFEKTFVFDEASFNILQTLFENSSNINQHAVKVIDCAAMPGVCCAAENTGAKDEANPKIHGLGKQWDSECTFPTRWGGTDRITLIGDAAHAFYSEDGQAACMALEDAAVLIRHIKESLDNTDLKSTKKRRGAAAAKTATCNLLGFSSFEEERIPRVMRMNAMQRTALSNMFKEESTELPVPLHSDMQKLQQFAFEGFSADSSASASVPLRAPVLLNYRSFDDIKRFFIVNLPLLTLVSTEEDWLEELHMVKGPTNAMITVTNRDGNSKKARCYDFINGICQHLTVAEKNAKYLTRSIKGDTRYIDRENALLDCLDAMMPHPLSIVKLGTVAESGSGDAYFKMSNDDMGPYVGIQATCMNYSNFRGRMTMHKSPSDLKKMIIELGFVFLCGIYSENILCGCYVLTPDDSEFVQALSFVTAPGFSVFQKRANRTGSIAEGFAPYLYLWQKSASSIVNTTIKDAFSQKITNFLSKAQKKHSIKEFSKMLTPGKLKEAMYLEQYKENFFPDLKRLLHQRGDVSLTLTPTLESVLEFKLAHKIKGSIQYSVNFRNNGTEPMDLNLVSVYTIVLRTTDDVSEADATTMNEVYKYFIHLPTRTLDGNPNVRHDEPLATSFLFYFDRDSRVLRSKFLKDDSDYLVLVAGEPVTESARRKLVEFTNRPAVGDMDAIVKRFYAEKRDHEQEMKTVRMRNKRKRKRDAVATEAMEVGDY